YGRPSSTRLRLTQVLTEAETALRRAAGDPHLASRFKEEPVLDDRESCRPSPLGAGREILKDHRTLCRFVGNPELPSIRFIFSREEETATERDGDSRAPPLGPHDDSAG